MVYTHLLQMNSVQNGIDIPATFFLLTCGVVLNSLTRVLFQLSNLEYFQHSKIWVVSYIDVDLGSRKTFKRRVL